MWKSAVSLNNKLKKQFSLKASKIISFNPYTFKMKHLLLLFAVATLMVGCAQAPDADKAKVENVSKSDEVAAKAAKSIKGLSVDTEKSQISWVGTKPTGSHTGTFKLSKGKLSVVKDELKGSFAIDMKSLQVTDLEGEGAAKLAGHLMSDDFFRVEEHPEARFILTGTKPFNKADFEGQELKMADATHTATGLLTMLGVSKKISFPAKVTITDSKVTAEANFNIDRTSWGITYGNDSSLGNKFIKPEVNIGIILASK